MRKIEFENDGVVKTIQIRAYSGNAITVALSFITLIWAATIVIAFSAALEAPEVKIAIIAWSCCGIWIGFIIFKKWEWHLSGVERLHLWDGSARLERSVGFVTRRSHIYEVGTIINARVLHIGWGKTRRKSQLLVFDSGEKSHSIGIGVNKEGLDAIRQIVMQHQSVA